MSASTKYRYHNRTQLRVVTYIIRNNIFHNTFVAAFLVAIYDLGVVNLCIILGHGHPVYRLASMIKCIERFTN